MDEYLGKKARDIVSGLEGIIVSKGEYLSGCIRYCIQPACAEGDTSTPDREWVDMDELEIIGPGVTDKLPRRHARESKDDGPSAVAVTGGPKRSDPPKR